MHPKTEIRPDSGAIDRVLKAGWVGQLKIHGHRAQIHVPASADEAVIVYARAGHQHKKALTPSMEKEIRRLFTPELGWNVLDAEWLKPEEKIFVFDYLKKDGKLLRGLTYPERWAMLPRAYLSPHLQTLPLLKTLSKCLEALESREEHVEGLVFKSLNSTGFSDTSILRCRRRK